MLWEIEIQPKGHDPERDRVAEEYDLLTHGRLRSTPISRASRGYLIEGDLDAAQADQLVRELLVDSLAETGQLGRLNATVGQALPAALCNRQAEPALLATVLLKPGVMDPTALSIVEAACDLGIPVDSVRSFRRYYGAGPLPAESRDVLFRKVLANEAIEQVIEGPLSLDHLTLGSKYTFQLVTVPLRELDDDGLMKVSRDGQLSLSLAEMRTIRGAFSPNRPRSDRCGTGVDRANMVGALLAQDAQGQDRVQRRGRLAALRQSAERDDLRRDAGNPQTTRPGRLVRQRL